MLSCKADFRAAGPEVRLTLLAVLIHARRSENTDALVDLLIGLVQKIKTRALRRVERQSAAEPKRMLGREGTLFMLAQAAADHPDEPVRLALFPVVGEPTLRDLVSEAKANEREFKAKVRTTLRSSYSTHNRQMLPPLLNTLGFRCNNISHRPVMQALDLLAR